MGEDIGLFSQSATAFLTVSMVASLLYGFLWSRKSPSLGKTVIKSLPVSCLAIVSIVEGAPIYLGIGLALGALGDMFLSLEEEKGFLPGLGAFLLGHIAFVVLFLKSGVGLAIIPDETWRLVIVLGLILFAAVMFLNLLPHLDNLLPAVAAYVLVILAMGVSALTLDVDLFGFAVVGAAMFIVSDAILSCELFLMAKESHLRRVTSPLLWFLYWGGQLLILIAFVSST